MTAETTIPQAKSISIIEAKEAFDIDAYEREKQAQQERLDANRDEMIKCLDPNYAKMRELEKPVYRWRVEASWQAMGEDKDGLDQLVRLRASEIVIAQNAADAWAAFCDRLQTWPSIRTVKPTITQLNQVSVIEAMANVVQSESPLPEKTLVPIRRPRQLA